MTDRRALIAAVGAVLLVVFVAVVHPLVQPDAPPLGLWHYAVLYLAARIWYSEDDR